MGQWKHYRFNSVRQCISNIFNPHDIFFQVESIDFNQLSTDIQYTVIKSDHK